MNSAVGNDEYYALEMNIKAHGVIICIICVKTRVERFDRSLMLC